MNTELRSSLHHNRVSVLTALLLLSLYLLLGRPAQAGASLVEGEVTRGSLLLQTEQGAVPAPALHTDVQMQVSGLLARVKLRQRFRNPGSDWAEAVYVFPLPEQAAVDHLRMQIGERIIEGQIQEKAQAKKTFAQARQDGKRASLVEQERPNIFTTSVTNIGPGEAISVEIEYQQTLHYADGEFRLRFPLVVGPRYIPGTALAAADRIDVFSGDGWAQDTDQVPDASRITPPVQHPDAGPLNPVSLGIELDAGFPLASVTSSYHAIHKQDRGAQRVHIELAAGEVPADRDFELVWRPLPGSEPTAAWFSQSYQAQQYGMLMLMPPVDLPGAQPAVPREVVFVIDTSGSMHGDSIAQAREALVLALARLKPADRFNLIQFNHTSQALFSGSQPASAERVRQAQRYVRNLQAEGGTEMLPALQMALQPSDANGLLRQIVFLTDGSVGNEEALFAGIRSGLGDSRLFTIGIGSAPNSHFMRKAAEYGRGTFTYLGDTAEVADRMQALFRKLEHPALTDIRLETAEGVALDQYPGRIPDLYLGEPLLLMVRTESLPGAVTVKGNYGAQPWQTQLTLAGGGSDHSLAPEWARRRIDDLLSQRREAKDGASRDALREAALDTALEHHLVSEFTSLVAVDVTPARTREEVLKRHALPTNLPKGWSHAHVFGTAKTATPAQLQLLIGLALLAIAAWFGWRQRHAVQGSANDPMA